MMTSVQIHLMLAISFKKKKAEKHCTDFNPCINVPRSKWLSGHVNNTNHKSQSPWQPDTSRTVNITPPTFTVISSDDMREDGYMLEISNGKGYKRTLAFSALLAGCLLVIIPISGRFTFDKETGSDDDSTIIEMLEKTNASEGLAKHDILTSAGSNVANEQNEHNESRNTGPFHRIDDTPEKTGKLPFLKNYRNPCWKEAIENTNKTRVCCLPYFYLVGAPKCGTTDLFRRLRKHPQISNKVQKEQHWLTRKRFMEDNSKLSSYLAYFEDAVKRDILLVVESDYHPMIFGDGSASTLWDNRRLLQFHKDTHMKLPPFTNADIIKKLNPYAKIIIMLRNPVTRLYSEYLYFGEGKKSAEEFHKQVVSSIYYVKDCLRRYAVRYCTYFMRPALRLQVGFYHIFIEDYFQAFASEQVKIIKLENYSLHMADAMNDVYNFLGLDKPSDETMSRIITTAHAKEHDEDEGGPGDMLPKTRDLLAEFYRTWNEKLVKLIGEGYRYKLRT